MAVIWLAFWLAGCAWSQQGSPCARLSEFKISSVQITKASPVADGSSESNPYGQGSTRPLPAYYRVEAVINSRIGVGGEQFGIHFALARHSCLAHGVLSGGRYRQTPALTVLETNSFSTLLPASLALALL